MSVLISALHQTSPERVTVALDDGSEIKATLGVVAELRLYAGRRLTEAELKELRASAALALCKNRGLELLSYRPMSAKELRDKLTEKGEEPAAAEAAVTWLCEHSFLDDARYAGMVVRHYAGKGYGAGRIRQELQRRGVPRELWEEALTELPESDDKLDRFIASRLKDPSDRAQVQKVSAALYRRGFSWEEIRAALARFRADAGE
jgi:regulatory protein